MLQIRLSVRLEAIGMAVLASIKVTFHYRPQFLASTFLFFAENNYARLQYIAVDVTHYP